MERAVLMGWGWVAQQATAAAACARVKASSASARTGAVAHPRTSRAGRPRHQQLRPGLQLSLLRGLCGVAERRAVPERAEAPAGEARRGVRRPPRPHRQPQRARPLLPARRGWFLRAVWPPLITMVMPPAATAAAAAGNRALPARAGHIPHGHRTGLHIIGRPRCHGRAESCVNGQAWRGQARPVIGHAPIRTHISFSRARNAHAGAKPCYNALVSPQAASTAGGCEGPAPASAAAGPSAAGRARVARAAWPLPPAWTWQAGGGTACACGWWWLWWWRG